MSHAYDQMVLDGNSKKYVTINTHRRLYRYNRLPYGVSSAPGILQRTIKSLLNGIPHTGALLDNIFITGPTEEEHLRNLEEVLHRISEASLRLKSKYRFMLPVLECLGYRIDACGIYPVKAKVGAVKGSPYTDKCDRIKAGPWSDQLLRQAPSKFIDGAWSTLKVTLDRSAVEMAE